MRSFICVGLTSSGKHKSPKRWVLIMPVSVGTEQALSAAYDFA